MKKLKLSQGFTLIELIAVMVIISIIAGLLVGAGGAARRQAKNAKARSMISSLEAAIQLYRADTAAYPPDTSAWFLHDHLTNTAVHHSTTGSTPIPGWFGPYMEFESDDLMTVIGHSVILDPWSKPTPAGVRIYQYDENPAAGNTNSFNLWSYGADGINGTSDDITNW